LSATTDTAEADRIAEALMAQLRADAPATIKIDPEADLLQVQAPRLARAVRALLAAGAITAGPPAQPDAG
jgi:hypothetical protein